METELIEKLKKREITAVQEIIRQYNRRLFSVVFRFVHNIEDAEDIVQETWIKFFNALSHFEGRSSLYTYLYRIAINEALMHIRKNKIKNFFIYNNKNEIPDETTPETLYLKNEQNTVINDALKNLPHKQKQVFLLRKSENLSFKEIGEIMYIKENNAKVLFFYALHKIKNYLKDRGYL